MAFLKTKVDTVTDILSRHLVDDIKSELRRKLMAHVEDEIEEIVKQVTYDMVDKIEAYNNTNGEISVNILFKGQPK